MNPTDALPEAIVDRDFFCMHSELCKTLANDKRQMILASLREDELSVSELVERTSMTQSNLSQHLSRMRAHGVVNSRREGNRIFYRIANLKLLQAFDLITEVMQESADERARSSESRHKEDVR